jgi:hypothetical protein
MVSNLEFRLLFVLELDFVIFQLLQVQDLPPIWTTICDGSVAQLVQVGFSRENEGISSWRLLSGRCFRERWPLLDSVALNPSYH